MKQRIICKGLTVATILMFIGVGIQPAIALANKKQNIKEELIENPAIEKLDNQIEIISYIGGIAFQVNKTGFVFNRPIRITPWKSAIFIFGIKHPSFNPYRIFFYYHPNCIIKVSRFFGIVKQVKEMSFEVYGIAIGNVVHIEW